MTNLRSLLSSGLTVHTPDPTKQRRGHLMALFLMTAIAMMLVLLAIDLAESLNGSDPTWLITDIIVLIILAAMFVLNRRGRVRLAAAGAILLVIAAAAVLVAAL